MLILSTPAGRCDCLPIRALAKLGKAARKCVELSSSGPDTDALPAGRTGQPVVLAELTMSGVPGETRSLLPKESNTGTPVVLRASDVGVTVATRDDEKKSRRWHFTAAGLLAPAAACALLLVVAFAVVPNTTLVSTFGARQNHGFARLGSTDADDFFGTQFSAPGGGSFEVQDEVGGLGMKTHRTSKSGKLFVAEQGSSKAKATSDKHEKTTTDTDSSRSKTEASQKSEETTEKGAKSEAKESTTVDAAKAPEQTKEVSTEKASKAETSSESETSKADVSKEMISTSEDAARSSNADKFKHKKPKILVAVISWQNGAEEVAAMEDTWLSALTEANEYMDADYRVFVGESSDADLGGQHARARVQEHRDRRGFGGNAVAMLSKAGLGLAQSTYHPARGHNSLKFGAHVPLNFEPEVGMLELSESLEQATVAFEESRYLSALGSRKSHGSKSDEKMSKISEDLLDAIEKEGKDSSSKKSTTTNQYDSKHVFTSRLAEAVSKGNKGSADSKPKVDLQAEFLKDSADVAAATGQDADLKKQFELDAADVAESVGTTEDLFDGVEESKTERSDNLDSDQLDLELEQALKAEKATKKELEKSREEKVVKLSVGDSYEDLPQKVLGAIEYANDNDYDYVYKVDTDVFVLPAVFLKFVKTQVVDKNVDWMGSENKMYPVQYIDPKLVDRSDPNNAKLIEENTTPSGFKCGLAREWHFGKCTDVKLNHKPYMGVNPISVDGGHGYILSKDAMWAVSDYVWKRSEDLNRHTRVDIYEDQLISHILVKQGFLPVDYSGVSPFKVSGVTKEMADDACGLATDAELGARVGERLRAMRAYRFESGANLYETAAGWNPGTMEGRMLPTSLMRVGIQPYVWKETMVQKWEYFVDHDLILGARDDGTYEPKTLPLGFELNPELTDDVFALPEFPDDVEEKPKDDELLKSKKSKHSSKNSSLSDAEKLAAFKSKHPKDSDDEVSKNASDDDSSSSKKQDIPDPQRPGAWITVEELSDDPFAEPEWLGDDSDVVKAQVQEMLEQKRKERAAKGDTEEDDAATEAEDAHEMRLFEIAEAEKKANAKKETTAKETAEETVKKEIKKVSAKHKKPVTHDDDSYDGTESYDDDSY